jgi:hypothetical protein
MSMAIASLQTDIETGLQRTASVALPNHALARYFMDISERRGVSPAVRDFLIDLSVWSEGDEEHGDFFRSRAAIVERYEKEIRPLVTETRGLTN